MDAPEDRDVKLRKVSGDLLAQFGQRLPELLQAEGGEGGRRSTVDSLISLIEPFQESPQLLDPHLQSCLGPLTGAFLARLPAAGAGFPPPIALHDAVAKLLYTLCKIRGPKIISRFLPNAPRHLEPLAGFAAADPPERSWELRYVLLLWLGHLLLTPFDLSTISAPAAPSPPLPPLLDLPALPSLARRLLALALARLASPGNRESDAASLLVARLCLRRDMRELHLLTSTVSFCLHTFRNPDSPTPLFLQTAALRVLSSILASGDRSTVAPLAPEVLTLVAASESAPAASWDSASIRRLAMKIYRWSATLSGPEDPAIEDTITRLLVSLGDKDTAVRLGASKSLAVISRRLPAEMAGEVLEAVMAIYDEDVFLHPATKRPVHSAVSADKWHGASLTLAAFLRQRAVRSVDVLRGVVGCIIAALRFEQRRATFAVGGNVRDAACYAAWSLARSYSTAELAAVGEVGGASVMQLLATELVVAGCLDPLGNIRRAASAGLQELIGRHPNTVVEGIRVVQLVDYNAVALRKRSVANVAGEVAGLDAGYWSAIVDGIVEGWRGVGSSDQEGRKLSGIGLGRVVLLSLPGDTADSLHDRTRRVVTSLIHRIQTDGRSDIEIYHGTIWALAEVLFRLSAPAFGSSIFDAATSTLLLTAPFAKLTGKEFLNPVLRPELTSESAARLVSALSDASRHLPPIPISTLRICTAIVEASLDRTDDPVLDQAVPASSALLALLSSKNQHVLITSWTRRASRKRGFILALGKSLTFVPPPHPLRTTIINTLLAATAPSAAIETRVCAIRALGAGLVSTDGLSDPAVTKALVNALNDYSVDTRGDIGSWARAEAIGVIHKYWTPSWTQDCPELVCHIVRLSVERLDRVRTRASETLLAIAAGAGIEPYIDVTVLAPDLAANSVSSKEYFGGLIRLLEHSGVRASLLSGYVTSAGAGSDSLLRTSRGVLLEYLAGGEGRVAVFLETVLRVLESEAGDRVIIPAVEVLAAVLEANVMCETKLVQRCFVAVQRVQYKSGNPVKLAAAVRAYGGMVMCEGESELGRKVLGKLVGMLLHPFPKVREAVAGTVYVLGHCLGFWGDKGEKVEKVLVEGDWLGGVKDLRAGVGMVKGALEIVG